MRKFSAGRWNAADGTALRMRPVRRDDTERLRSALARVSPDARRQRFLAPVAGFSEEFVLGLTEAAPERQHVLLVVRQESGEDIPVAGGRFIVDETSGAGDSCEFALIIGEAWQGQGIGRRLLRALIAEAQARHLKRMIGHILLDNRSMLTLARHCGFRIEPCPGDERTRLAILDLPESQGNRQRGISGWLAKILGRR